MDEAVNIVEQFESIMAADVQEKHHHSQGHDCIERASYRGWNGYGNEEAGPAEPAACF